MQGEFDIGRSEIVSQLMGQLNEQRAALKKAKVYRNKLCEIASSQFMKQGIKPDNPAFVQQ